jgi:UDP-N-acetylmuramoyl-L-alanyl-D-glutamate--2,6-diaminopimelate ligase
MRLSELAAVEGLQVLTAVQGHASGGVPAQAGGVEISSLAYDSRRVQPGALFFCVRGLERDGHEFAPQAVAAGAGALVVERPLGLGVPEVLVRSARAAMGPLAARFYGDPTASLRVVGVTGTNGKTTTAYLERALLEAGGERCGLLGTVKSVIAGQERPAGRTTPEAVDLQADFRAMLDGGERACAMEVSSHALALGRTDAVRFAAAIFTNLSRDHLDFHASMEDYFQAKRRLFVDGRPGVSVLNVGDRHGRRLALEVEDAVTFAVEGDAGPPAAGRKRWGGRAEGVRLAGGRSGGARQAADYWASSVRSDAAGSRFRLHTPVDTLTVALPLPGRFNVANALGALAAAHALGGELATLVETLGRGVRVPGRFEPVDEGQDFAVIVDYAHTPDSLENALRAARELAAPRGGRVLCVFGAGGDRDPGKRPLMGRAAARLTDLAIVTSDNPRSEDPEAIVAQVMAGVAAAQRPAGAAEVEAEVDRRAAIERAVELARAGDVVVIAGKGHEQGQEFAAGHKIPFDDASVAREALGARVG